MVYVRAIVKLRDQLTNQNHYLTEELIFFYKNGNMFFL